MPIRLSCFLPLLLLLFLGAVVHCPAGAAQQDSSRHARATGNVYSDAAPFAAELQRIGSAIAKEKANVNGLGFLRKNLPAGWEISTSERRYLVSAEPLRGLLGNAEREKNVEKAAAKAKEAADWAFDLANQVNAYAGARAYSTPGARAELDRILSRREFGSVQGPTRWDLLRQRINRWIEKLILRFFERMGRHPVSARILLWSMVVATVVWLAVTLFRYWTRRAALEALQAPDSVAFVRTWQEWIHAAREAAAQGDFREAIHSTYWAGISYLEDSEVVRKDRARTPREYVRLVSNSTPFAVSRRGTREALSALTLALEQVWYGRQAASSEDFKHAMRQVEALGCQLQ